MKPLGKKLYVLMLLAATLLVMLALESEDASGKTLTVDDDGGAEYTHIQEAIDSAENGDTIKVYAGTYNENVDVTKSLTIKSTSENPADTIVNASDSNDHVFEITVDYVNISGFTVMGAINGYIGIGGIFLNNVNHCNIFNNNLMKNFYGIYFTLSSNNYIYSNNVLNNYDGIFVIHSSSNNEITNNNISNNTKGILIESLSNDNTIDNNNISNQNHGILLFHSSNNNLICNSILNNYQGITSFSSSENNIECNNVSNNNCGIRLGNSSNVAISNNKISGNKIGIDLQDESKNNIAHHNLIYRNIDYGINANDNDGYDIDATNNWWGNETGPYHPIENTNGVGDNITDYVIFDPWTTTFPDSNFFEVTNTDSYLKIRQDHGISSDVIQCVPDSWVLKIVDSHENTIAQDGFIWWEVEDPTTGVSGWAAKEFLNQGDQTELSEKVQSLTTPEERTPVILEAMNHYYQNEDTKSSLHSSKDGNNDFTVLHNNDFPIELILAIAVQESGDFDFDNEVYGMDKVGDFENGGIGIMQITGNNKGWGSNLQCYCEHCGKADSTHLYSYPGGERYNHKYYTNSYQGIYANIKDGFRVLQWAYQDALQVNADNPIAGAVWRYNVGSQWKTQAEEYLIYIGARLLTLSEYYGENYASYFQGYQPLSEEDIQAWSNDLQNYVIASIHSPGELGMYDSQGRFSGVTNGEVTIEIPDTDYYEGHVITFLANDSYYYEVVGTAEGTYGLTITSVKNGTLTNFTAIDIPTNKSEVHTYSIDWDALSQGEKAVTITIDREGDGKVDYTIQTNGTFTKDEYDAAMKCDGDGKNGDSDSFLFENIGPLPLIGYIGIVAVILIVGFVAVKKGKGKTEAGMTPATVPSQQPPPAQSPSSTQLPYQQPPQPPQPPPARPPQQAPPQQYDQPQQYQQYAQAPQVSSQEIPMQADGMWICQKCGNRVERKFIFCTECGFKKGG